MSTPAPTTSEPILRVLIAWLNKPEAAAIAAQTAGWDEQSWQQVAAEAFRQGVGAYLYDCLSSHSALPHVSPHFQSWLAEEHRLNTARIERLHGELGTILQVAAQQGVSVMPLKGSVLSLCYYPHPALRPMADLDLLVPPSALFTITEILQSLHYQRAATAEHYPNHERFHNRHAETVVSRHHEHPDNPRPVEVHTELRRTMWQRAGAYDLTAYLWEESQRTTLLREQAWLPTPNRLLTYVAIHACSDLLLGRGRLIQWLDLAHLVARGARVDPHLDERYATWIYPVLQLAQRAFPTAFTAIDLAQPADHVHPSLRRWATQVPLDSACGLAGHHTYAGEQLSRLQRLHLRWQRWRPAPWRLRIGYPQTPLPIAYGRHCYNLMLRWWEMRPQR